MTEKLLQVALSNFYFVGAILLLVFSGLIIFYRQLKKLQYSPDKYKTNTRSISKTWQFAAIFNAGLLFSILILAVWGLGNIKENLKKNIGASV